MDNNQPTLTVPPKRKPSFVNMRAAIGLAIGWVIPIPFAPLIGLAAGAWSGKRKMQHEETNGRQVSPPSSWNTGTFLGGVGGLNAGAAVVLTALATGGIGLGVWLGAAACIGIGSLIGGKVGKHFQKKEYAAAEQHVAQHGQFAPSQQGQAAHPAQSQNMGQQPPQMAPQQQAGQSATLAQAHQQMNPQQLAQLQAFAAQGQRMAPPQPESMSDKVGHSRPQGPQER